MNFAINFFQSLALLLAAPLLRGILARFKALLQNRHGAGIWRPYAELFKLFRKEDLFPSTASPIFRLAPLILFSSTLAAAAFVPFLHPSALLASHGDFLLLVYLLALGRFFLSLGALDGGSSFAGMGASREALVSSLAESPLLLSLAAVSILASRASIAPIVSWTLHQSPFHISAVHILAFTSFAMVALAESGRMPVDNPDSHLELTMIHHAMLLEYSGPSLALIEWAGALKLHVLLALLLALFCPWGMASASSPAPLALALLLYCSKALLLLLFLAFIESAVAKLRMYLVPEFLGVASAVSALAVIFTALTRG